VLEAQPNATALPAEDEPVVVGREQELAQLTKILGESQPMLVVVKGRAGVGKTSLLQAFRTQAEAAGWNTAPYGASAEFLSVTTATTEETFSAQVQTLLAVPRGKSYLEKSQGKSSPNTSAEQAPLLAIVEQLRGRAPLLLLIDGYLPAPEFMDWFQNRFVPDVSRAGAPVVVIVAERPEGTAPLEPSATQIIVLERPEEEAIRQHFIRLGEQISPPLQEDELNIYVETANKQTDMLVSLTRVLRLARHSESERRQARAADGVD
jgi:hypothetical protein